MFRSKRKLSTILICSLLFVQLGCQDNRVEEVPTPVQHISDEPGEQRVNPFSVWDELAAKNDVEGGFMVDSPEEPDLFKLYVEGLYHTSPYVQWYSSNKVSSYGEHPDKQQAIDALQLLLHSPDDKVISAAQFALNVFEHNFSGPEFIHSPDGKKVAFHLYQDARYNDGEVWVFNEEWSSSIYPLNGLRPSIDLLEWSPDGKNIAIEYGGRIWGDVDLVNSETGQSLLERSVNEVLMEHNLYTVVERERPDPYYRLVEWSPDSSKAMLSYSFTDDDERVQQGIVVYDLNKAEYTKVSPYPPGDNPYPEVSKPDGFTW